MTSGGAAPPLTGRLRAATKTITVGAVGNIVEWYDWGAYALMAAVFAKQIFPAHDALTSLIAALITYAVGFLFRPLGSVLLSPYGDRVGRRRLLSLTILLMGVGSILIAVTPPYAVIGVASPILFLVARVIQGISAGGEFQSSSAYLVEHAPPDRRGLIGSMQLVSIAVATMVASGVSGLTTALIPQPMLGQWGWRIPFVLGAVIALYGLYLRRSAPETPAFEEVEREKTLEPHPLRALLRDHRLDCLRVVAIQITTVPYYMWTVFLPTYAHLTSGLPLQQGLLGATIGLLVFIFALPLVGHLSDRFGRKPFLAVQVGGLLLMACIDGVMAATVCEFFPTRVRASGIGVPYALTAAVFSGTAPLVATYFISRGQPMAIAFYVIAICVFAGIMYLQMPETRTRTLTGAQPRVTPE
jgi:MHS family alpha-ketoglutarate permease-like MFS transporter